MAYDSVFKRVEKKYRTMPRQRAAVEAAARDAGAMAVDAYGRTRITSLYLDTPERAMIARSVEKPLYKEKLRLRAYGEAAGAALMAAFGAGPLVRNADWPPLSDAEVEARAAAVPGGEATAVFFGIKKKFKGVVYKRRIALALPAAVAFVSGLPYERACVRWPLADAEQAVAALAPASRQIARELEAAMDRWLPLAPSMGIACDREAWGVRCALAGEPWAAGFAARDTAAARVPAAADGVAPELSRLPRAHLVLATYCRAGRVHLGDQERRALPALARGRAFRPGHLPRIVHQVRQRLPTVRGHRPAAGRGRQLAYRQEKGPPCST